MGAAAVAGHNWPIFLAFRGGKGAATTLGVFFALLPRETLLVLAIAALVVPLTRNPVLGLAAGFVALGLWLIVTGHPTLEVAYFATLPALVGLRHVPTAWDILVRAENKREALLHRLIFDRSRRKKL